MCHKTKSASLFFARLGLIAFSLVIAAGHLWLLLKQSAGLSAFQHALLVLAIVGSLAVAALSRRLCDRPLWILILVLAAVFLHSPASLAVAGVAALVPTVLIVGAASLPSFEGVLTLAGVAPSRRWQPPVRAMALPIRDPHTLPLFSRPPPRSV